MKTTELSPFQGFSIKCFTKNEKRFFKILLFPLFMFISFSFIKFEINASILLSLGSLLFYFAAIFLYWIYAHGPLKHHAGGNMKLALIVVCSIVLSIILEAGTLIGSPSSTPLLPACWSKRRLVLFAFLSFFAITVGIAHYSFRKESTRALKSTEKSTFYNLLRPAAIVMLCGAFGFLTGAASWETSRSIDRFSYLILCLILLATMFFLLIKHRKVSPERVFLLIALVFGTYLCISLPPITGNSWDDQIHYGRSAALSFLGNADFSESDYILNVAPIELSTDPDAAASRLEMSLSNSRMTSTTSGSLSNTTPAGDSILTITSIGYIPSAIGLWLGRLLHLPSAGIVILGRWGNLIGYSIVMYFAIKIIPVKKILLTAIALLPTSLFLASNYSYDPWVISWLSLGLALIFREVYSGDSRLSALSLSKITGSLLLGLCPKAIYFPVIGLLFLLPKSKFNNQKQFTQFIAFIIVFGLAIIATFILPLLFSPATQAGDIRGGTDVNSAGQIAFIISNPFAFASTLLRFLIDYLSPANSFGYTISFSYLSDGTKIYNIIKPFVPIPVIALLIIAIFDKSPRSTIGNLSRLSKLWIAFIFIITVCLIATSLYISFTPVGLNTVNGCQPRYLLPVLLLPLGLFECRTVRPDETCRMMLSCSLCQMIIMVFCLVLYIVQFTI